MYWKFLPLDSLPLRWFDLYNLKDIPELYYCRTTEELGYVILSENLVKKIIKDYHLTEVGRQVIEEESIIYLYFTKKKP